MSTTIAADVPIARTSTPRPMGWSALPPRCARCRRRLEGHGLLTHAGGLRCRHCTTINYVLVCAPVALAFVAAVSAKELEALHTRGATVAEVLAFLGAPMLLVPTDLAGAPPASPGRPPHSSEPR